MRNKIELDSEIAIPWQRLYKISNPLFICKLYYHNYKSKSHHIDQLHSTWQYILKITDIRNF